jgi:hypothetical protein
VQGAAAERFVVFGLRVLAISFAVVGILYVALPSASLDFMSNVGELFGNHTRAPHTQEYLWLSLGFAYMAVITGICLIAQTDVVRYRPLLLLLAAGKAASSFTSLVFFFSQGHVFAYLLGALVDGSLILVALWLWVLTGRIDRPLRSSPRRAIGASERRTLSAICEAMAPGIDGLPRAERDVDVSGRISRFLESVPPRMALQLRIALRAFEWLPFPHRFSRLDAAGRERVLRGLERSRWWVKHDLLLMAKLFSTLGYAVTPAVQERVGFEVGCALADGEIPEPAGSLGDTEAPPEDRNATW